MYSNMEPWYQSIDSSPVHPEIQCAWTSPPGRCKNTCCDWLVKTTCSNVHSDWSNRLFTALSYLPRQTCYKAFIFLTPHTVWHDWSLVFLTLGNVHQSYFVRLATGGNEKPSILTLVTLNNSFPALNTNNPFLAIKTSFIFPALLISYKYSMRFQPLSRFPAPSNGYKFSRAFGRLQISPCLRTVICLPALSIGHPFALNADCLQGQSGY